MAERKKVKGKKPAETMRQAQRRKLAEQRAKKARAKGVKTNPTGPARGAKVQQDLPYKVLAAVRLQLWVETLDAVGV